jgi:hypothetical protein
MSIFLTPLFSEDCSGVQATNVPFSAAQGNEKRRAF